MFRQRFFVITVAGLAALFLGASFVLASTVSDEVDALNKEIATRKERIKQLESTIATYNKTITQKQTQAASLKNQLSILDNSVAKINADIELTQQKIEQAEFEMKELLLNIGTKEATIAKQKKVIEQMIRSLHEGDQKSYFEIMTTYTHFSEFYNELKATENVYVDLGRSVKALRLIREDLSIQEKAVEAKRATLKDLQEQMGNKKSDLGQQIDTKSTLLLETKSSEARYQSLLGSLKSQYQVIEGEVNSFEAQVRKKLEQQNKIPMSGGTDVTFSWPVPSHYINAYFHDPGYPFKNVFQHSGIDIKASQGTPVRAAASGYVGRARRCSVSSCYAYVLLIHTASLSSLYGHLSTILVADDAFVNRGDLIGYSGGRPGTVGAGPFVTGAHLHFEARLNGIPVNALPYMQ